MCYIGSIRVAYVHYFFSICFIAAFVATQEVGVISADEVNEVAAGSPAIRSKDKWKLILINTDSIRFKHRDDVMNQALTLFSDRSNRAY